MMRVKVDRGARVYEEAVGRVDGQLEDQRHQSQPAGAVTNGRVHLPGKEC